MCFPYDVCISHGNSRRIEVDGPEHSAGGVEVLGRRVPLVLAGVVGDVSGFLALYLFFGVLSFDFSKSIYRLSKCQMGNRFPFAPLAVDFYVAASGSARNRHMVFQPLQPALLTMFRTCRSLTP